MEGQGEGVQGREEKPEANVNKRRDEGGRAMPKKKSMRARTAFEPCSQSSAVGVLRSIAATTSRSVISSGTTS